MLSAKNIIAFNKKKGISGIDYNLFKSASAITLSMTESNRNGLPCEFSAITNAQADSDYRKYLIYKLMSNIS